MPSTFFGGQAFLFLVALAPKATTASRMILMGLSITISIAVWLAFERYRLVVKDSIRVADGVQDTAYSGSIVVGNMSIRLIGEHSRARQRDNHPILRTGPSAMKIWRVTIAIFVGTACIVMGLAAKTDVLG